MESTFEISPLDADNIADALNIATSTSGYSESGVQSTYPAVTQAQLDYLKALAAWIKAHNI